jgi:hypothetical protein
MTWCMGTGSSLFIHWAPLNCLHLCLASGGTKSEFKTLRLACLQVCVVSFSPQAIHEYTAVLDNRAHSLPFTPFPVPHSPSLCCLSNGYVVIFQSANGYIVIYHSGNRYIVIFQSSNGYIVIYHSANGYIVIYQSANGYIVIITNYRMLYCHFCHSSNGYIVTCHSSSAYIAISAICIMVILSSAIRRIVIVIPAIC